MKGLFIALVLSTSICPVCGNDATIITNGQIETVHNAEDACPGDLYSVIDDAGEWSLYQYLGYLY